jgi:hypothetical protein
MQSFQLYRETWLLKRIKPITNLPSRHTASRMFPLDLSVVANNSFHMRNLRLSSGRSLALRLLIIPSAALVFGLLPASLSFLSAPPSRKLLEASNNLLDAFLFLTFSGFLVVISGLLFRRFWSDFIARTLYWLCAYLISELTALGIVLNPPKSFHDILWRLVFFGFFLALYFFSFNSHHWRKTSHSLSAVEYLDSDR